MDTFAAEFPEVIGKCMGIGLAAGFLLTVSILAASALIGLFRHFLNGR